jgi:uncharacterized protein (TIGR03435 family)
MATGFRVLAATAVVSVVALASQQLLIPKPDFDAAGVRFETASIERSRSTSSGYAGKVEGKQQPVKLTFQNVSLQFCVQQAFGVKAYQVAGPGWIKSARYDITAALPAGYPSHLVWPALRNLLAERLQLSIRREKKELPIYALTIGNSGPKLRPGTAGGPEGLKFQPGRRERAGMHSGGSGTLRLDNASMAEFCADLSRHTDRPVLDSTGITGNFEFELCYSSRGEIAAALQKQLGLTLEPRKDEIEMLVVEKALRKPRT